MLLFWMMLNKASAHLETLSNNTYIRKISSQNIYLFKVNNRNTSKLTVKTPGQLPIVLIVNFGHILYPFLVFINVEITYCCNYWQMNKNFIEIASHKKRLWSKVVVPKKIFIVAWNYNTNILVESDYSSSYKWLCLVAGNSCFTVQCFFISRK